MSLPAAKQDLSLKPAKNGVSQPLDKAQLQKDINQKLKLYASIQAVRASRLPSNEQFDSFLLYLEGRVKSVLEEDSDKGLHKDTRKLFTDTTGILETLRNEVSSKNGDELLQQLIWNSRDVKVDVKLDESAKKAPVEKDKATQDAQTALQHLRTIGSLLLTNAEARKIVSDFSVVARDLLARGAAQTASGLAPTQEELAGADQAHRGAEGEKFLPKDQVKSDGDKLKGIFGLGKKEESSTSSGTSTDGTRATDTTSTAPAIPPVTAVPAPVNGIQEPSSSVAGQPTPASTAAPTSEIPVAATTEGADLNVARPGGAIPASDTEAETDTAGKKKSGFMSKFKSKGNDHVNRGKQFLSEEYFPKDRRDQWIYRGKKVILECQDHPEYQESINWLLDYIEEYSGHGTKYVKGAKSSAQIDKSEAVTHTLDSVRTLLDRFAGGKSIQALVIERFNTLLKDAGEDEELRNWLKDVGRWIREVLTAPGYVLEPASTNRGRELMETGRKFHGYRLEESKVQSIEGEGKYKPHFNALFDGIGEWIKGWGEDSANKKVSNAFSRFTKDLLFAEGETPDSPGKFTFKREMWSDIRRFVIPTLVERVGYVPIPRIEYTDENLDLVVENLTLSGKNLFPNIVDIEAHNYFKFSPYTSLRKEQDDSRHEFIVTLSQMQADMRDVAFYFKKKSMPKIKDSGLADVVLSGEGVTVKLHVAATPSTDKSSFITVKSVKAKVDNLKFSIRDSKHDLLYKTLKPLATGLIKKQIAKAIEDGITTGLGFVDNQLVSVRDRMEEAAQSDGASGEDGKKRMSAAFGDLFKTKSRQGSEVSETASTKTSNSQFKMVPNKRRSLLVNEGHPQGWVNRVQAKDDFKPADGDKSWKCDAFNLDYQPKASEVPASA